ncbi:hypothetical protein TNCV_4549411 [Trichonephila clavipes]|nr:hypothetical protein TNCV_4549411 [Trichonephila clavipes]
MVSDLPRHENHSPDRLLSRKNQWWFGQRQRVPDVDSCSFQSEIVGGVREARPGSVKRQIGREKGCVAAGLAEAVYQNLTVSVERKPVTDP